MTVTLALAGLATPAIAFAPREVRSDLDRLVFADRSLRVVETPTDAEQLRDRLSTMAAMDSFRADLGDAWRFTVDERRGITTLLAGGAIPFLPGHASPLPWEEVAPGCRDNACIPVAVAEARARDFLTRYRPIFAVNPAELELDTDGSGPFGRSLYLLRFQWKPGGVPVERGSIFFRINGGNLIQVATERVAAVALDPLPSLGVDAAWQVLNAYLGPDRSEADTVVDPGSLRFVPVTPASMDPDSFSGPLGSGISFRLVWRLAFVRKGVTGTWEALVDASSGELIRFVDANRYGRIHGGAYPGDNHVGEADRAFPFADTGLPAPNQYADAAGLFPGNAATTTLRGKYTWINDSCGPISNATTTGDVDFSLGPGTDCEVPSPNGGGAGNTHASRTQYYHLTNVNIKARTFLPGNSWLNNDHMNVNVNQGPYCNAGSGGGTIDFYQGVPGQCWNLGELPGVALHEWGHSLDDFDGSGGDSPPVETRADWTATLQTHDSCCGRGFFLTGNCSGYGDPCTECSGIRDADITKHQSQTPWTPVNYGSVWGCSGGWYYGPCGWEDHCESGISTQALWEFVTSDLESACGLDLPTAWALEDRLFYLSMPTLGDMYTCTPPSSNGCNGGSLYSTMMALDDDGDGTANGTPHAAAIFAALARHNIGCGTASDPKNQNHSSCPALATTTLTASPSSNATELSWTEVTNATRYLVFRNDVSCDAGFTRVGEAAAPSTSFTDTSVVNGIEYYYRLQAATGSDACVSGLSNCVAVTPVPCDGSVRLDSDTYTCSDTITVEVVDSDLAGVGSYPASAWSTVEPAAEPVTLTESPAGSGKLHGTIATSTSTAHGDGAVGVADGATITVRYVDADYCGTPNVAVDATAGVDCIAPQISGVGAVNVTGMGAEVQWTTDEVASSAVTYDVSTPPLAGTATSSDFVTGHSVPLSGLDECTRYYYSVASADPAGNLTTADNGGAYYTFTTLRNTSPSYVATDTPVSIPDNNPTGASSVIAVPDVKAVVDVDLTVNITHTYDGDISLYLIGPNATQITLAGNIGGGGDNYVDTTFDDEAANPISSGSPPFTGSFRPTQPLSAFDGVIAAGNWTFKVVDSYSWDTGTIDSWTLHLTYAAEDCEGVPLFADDFETGSTDAWSVVVP